MTLDPNYFIKDSLYLNPSIHYQNKKYYPKFQQDFESFKSELILTSGNRTGKNYYKFGDGDYYILSKQSKGTSKPGLRDLRKKDDLKSNVKLYNQIKEGSKLCDSYLCEIKFYNLFEEVMQDIKVNYPAEFAYGIVSSKWIFKNFDKIGLIGSNEKLKIIKELMNFNEYQEFLGIDRFEEYIGIPQVYALSKGESIYRKIKKKVENSNSEIFILGIGHVQNTLLHKIKKHTNVPMVCIGCGMDAIAGLVDVRRPYFGNWVNYRIKDLKVYDKVLDATMKSTNDEENLRYLN